MSTNDPTALPPWTREGPAQTVAEDPVVLDGGASKRWEPGQFTPAFPIRSAWSLRPPNDDGHGGVKI